MARGQWSVSPGWKVLLHALGLDAARILAQADLPRDLFARERAELSSRDYYRLWEALESEAADPALPVRICQQLSPEVFDPPIFAALCSENLNAALLRLAHYKPLIAPCELKVTVDERLTQLELVGLDRAGPPPRSLVLGELGFFVQLARLGTRERIIPDRVQSPIVPREKAFEAFFGVKVRPGSAVALRFSGTDAKRPFLTANRRLWSVFEPELRRLLSELDASATAEERVRSALLELLPSGDSSIGAVAKRMGTSPRTLQRRLQAEGHGYQEVLDRTRESLAHHYLQVTSLSGAEISFLLGFDDPNSFSRAFSSWTGTTPERARAALHA